MKKLIFALALVVLASAAAYASPRGRSFDLIVAPARYSVLQVMFDVAANRPAVLVSYQGEATTAEPLLHVWSGTAWNPITLHDLREISFVEKTPNRAVLLGGDDLLPVSVRDALAWMPEVVFVRDLHNANLLNEFGRLQKWTKREWQWFSTRYNLVLEDEAAPLRAKSWYDRPASSLQRDRDDVEPAPAPVTVTPRAPMLPPSSLPLQSDVLPPAEAPAPATTPSADVVEEAIQAASEVVEVVEPTPAPVEAPVK